MNLPPRFWKRERSDGENLDRAVTEWRSTPRVEERLSDAARTRIIEETIQAQETEPIPVRLRSAAWRVLAGALPVAAAVLLVLVFADRAGDRGTPVHVRATKTGNEVIFSIANGKRSHSVYKSSLPNSFDFSTRLAIQDGSFRDSADDASGVVFYRIE